MSAKVDNYVDPKEFLVNGDGKPCGTHAATKASMTKAIGQITRFQERIRRHIEDNYVDFMPNHTSSDLYLEDGEAIIEEAENLLESTGQEASSLLSAANVELNELREKLYEATLGLRVSQRILQIDDLFQYVEEANGAKEYAVVLDLLRKLKILIYSQGGDSASDGQAEAEVDSVFQKCQCYDTIKVKYHIQNSLLMQNLQQRFEQLVQLTEKPFPNAKSITIQVSKDENQLHDTVAALFQARYNPVKMCDFLLENCFEPLITKPVSVEYDSDHAEYVQMKLSYSLKDLGDSLRPNYRQVFEHLKLLLQCLGVINVSISEEQHVFSVLGDHIKERFLSTLVDKCLMHAIPETMDEMKESTLIDDVLQFEHFLADTFLINAEVDRALSEFAENFHTYFKNQFYKKLLDSANEIMQKDLQDMTLIAETYNAEDVANNPFLIPRCMVSRSTMELIKLMEHIIRKHEERENLGDEGVGDELNFLSVITVILNSYLIQVPKIHERLLESIPQQSALFYNNCMFLAYFVAKNSEKDIPTFSGLVKILQSGGLKYLNLQIAHQQKIIVDILKDLDLSDPHSLGTAPHKLVRQCLRQLELLKNVWQNVLPDAMYTKTFCELINDFCADIIRRILALEDISATVANELSELIDLILEKAPTLFKEKHEVIHVATWMKLQQLKMILNASLVEITEQWCEGAGILTANYKAQEIRRLIRALFQNTDRRAKALAKIV